MGVRVSRLTRMRYTNYSNVDFKRYPDGCYAVVSGSRRGPLAHSKVEALRRYWKSGLIKFVWEHGASWG